MITATPAHWRALHSLVVDAILAQHPEVRQALTLLVGLTSSRLVQALDSDRARVLSELAGTSVTYVVEVAADEGWVRLCSASAADLGLPPDAHEDELTFLAQQLAADVERHLHRDEP